MNAVHFFQEGVFSVQCSGLNIYGILSFRPWHPWESSGSLCYFTKLFSARISVLAEHLLCGPLSAVSYLSLTWLRGQHYRYRHDLTGQTARLDQAHAVSSPRIPRDCPV